jgi:anthranilate synthase component 1
VRQTNPSPYLFFLAVDGLAIIGSSPESLVRLQDGHVSTVPIAGTRPRGATREEDEQFESDLVSDPKELAEHVMLVDLGRNDIGRVSQPGSVAVKEFGTVARYSHVMHLVSKVTALLDDRFSAIEALKACFPAGTVSGAPKVRAMEIIDELETRKRGPYAGAVGYLDFSGNLDVCITIRTVVASRGLLHMQAGAGIVADSDPQREWDETENKLRALLSAAVTATRGFAPT